MIELSVECPGLSPRTPRYVSEKEIKRSARAKYMEYNLSIQDLFRFEIHAIRKDKLEALVEELDQCGLQFDCLYREGTKRVNRLSPD